MPEGAVTTANGRPLGGDGPDRTGYDRDDSDGPGGHHLAVAAGGNHGPCTRPPRELRDDAQSQRMGGHSEHGKHLFAGQRPGQADPGLAVLVPGLAPEGSYGLPAGTGCFGGCLVGGGGVYEEICGSHSSQRGRYQFQRPSRFIVAGSRHARTIGSP